MKTLNLTMLTGNTYSFRLSIEEAKHFKEIIRHENSKFYTPMGYLTTININHIVSFEIIN